MRAIGVCSPHCAASGQCYLENPEVSHSQSRKVSRPGSVRSRAGPAQRPTPEGWCASTDRKQNIGLTGQKMVCSYRPARPAKKGPSFQVWSTEASRMDHAWRWVILPATGREHPWEACSFWAGVASATAHCRSWVTTCEGSFATCRCLLHHLLIKSLTEGAHSSSLICKLRVTSYYPLHKYLWTLPASWSTLAHIWKEQFLIQTVVVIFALCSLLEPGAWH